MPLELAEIEESVLSNLAVLQAHGRDLLSETLVEDIRVEVNERVNNIRGGSTPEGVESAQASRVRKLAGQGLMIVGKQDTCLMSNPKCDKVVLVDSLGRVFTK